MADDSGTPFLSYFSVCARARASKERNERMKQKADLLDSIFKPINTEKLDMLKKNCMATVTNKKGKSIRHSKAIRLSISSSEEDDDDTHHSTSLSLSDDSYQSSMEDQNEEKSTREEAASLLPPNSTFYSSLHQHRMSFPSIPLLTLPQAAASMPSPSLPLTMSPDISLESFTTSSSSTPILTSIMAPIYTAAAPVSTNVTSSAAPLVSTVTPISTVVPPVSTLFNAASSITLVSTPISMMSIQTSTEDITAPIPLVSTAAAAASTSFISVAPPVASNVSVSMASNVHRASPSQSSSLSSLLDQPVIIDVKQQPQELIVSLSPSSVSSIEGHHSVEQFTYDNKDASNENNELLDASNAQKDSKEKEEDGDKSSLSSESDFWETPSTAPVMDRLHTHPDTVDDKTVSPNAGITATDNINPTTNNTPAPPDDTKQHKSSLQSHSGSTSSVDYNPKNATMAAFSLLHTLNAQLRRDHKLSKALYQTSTANNMQSSIQHSSVLNSLLTKRAELGKDMTTWDSGTLLSVLITSLHEVVAQHGPPVLKTDDKMLQRAGSDDDDEGWSTLLPLLLEHVRLLFQCGTLLEKVAQVFSPVLQTEENKLLTFFERECGAEEIFSLTPSSVSSLSQENEAEVNKKQSAYHSLLQSSVHSDVSDSLSEDSAVLALQLQRDTNTKPFGGINVMKGFGGEVGDKKDEFDGSLPLPSSPPSCVPQPRCTEPNTSSNQENTSGTTEKLNQSTLQKRMGQHEVDEIISSPLSGPSVDDNDDDDFDFYN